MMVTVMFRMRWLYSLLGVLPIDRFDTVTTVVSVSEYPLPVPSDFEYVIPSTLISRLSLNNTRDY
jgi:hypothetical protein